MFVERQSKGVIAMKGEGGKMVIKSKMKWLVLFGLILSAFSLFVHFLLARFTDESIVEFQSSITIFSWRPNFQSSVFPRNTPLYRRLWGPVRHLEYLLPDANPRTYYSDPSSRTRGFIFVRIQGGFHEIRNSICDVVAISRLLNATLVIPEIQSTTSSKGISSQFKSFAYLYDVDQFMAALENDVKIVKTLPNNLKGARRKKEIPLFKVPYSASPYYYLHHVLPVLNKHSVVELVVSNGGCLQATLPPYLEEYQRLRCRVAFHAFQFRQEVQQLAVKILQRLRAPGRPYIAYDPGMTQDALAYYGCAELFQDVHLELIQHKRSWMIKRGIIKEKLSVNSEERRLNGSCPLLPEEVGIILRAYGYSEDTIIYVSGGEVFGGQRTLIPLHALFENVVDRSSLSTGLEIGGIYGREANLETYKKKSPPSSIVEEKKTVDWATLGPRPRPLPPPPARPKTYNIEGWWGWVAESDNEPESTVIELRTNAHKLLWEAIDYLVCVEADVFLPGFDRDGKGHPNFASMVMGNRLYQSASSKTYRLNSDFRKEVTDLLERNRDNMYHANLTWLTSIRHHLTRSLVNGLTRSSNESKPLSFLAHPFPECSCLSRDLSDMSLNTSTPANKEIQAVLGVVNHCPAWMDSEMASRTKDKETEEDLEDDNSLLSGIFFYNTSSNHESVGEEEAQSDDQDEEGAE